MFIPILRHYGRVTAHKWHVFRAGHHLHVSLWQLVIHDLSKYGPKEAKGYALRFFTDIDTPQSRGLFEAAWRHHWQANPHHWEYWLTADGSPHAMPLEYVNEMVADWLAASRAYEGAWPNDRKSWGWLQQNFYTGRVKLHPDTRREVERCLDLWFGTNTPEVIEIVRTPANPPPAPEAPQSLQDDAGRAEIVARTIAKAVASNPLYTPQEPLTLAIGAESVTLKLDGLGYWYGTFRNQRMDVSKRGDVWVGAVNGTMLDPTYLTREEAVRACAGRIYEAEIAPVHKLETAS